MKNVMTHWRPLFVFLSLVIAIEFSQAAQEPQRLTGSFQHHPDIAIRLLVAEPDIVDPVGLAFDAWQRMYVVEMRDYPYGRDESHGSIRLLEFDETGTLERSSLFADELSFPTSVTPWKGGVFVTAPPQILYLKDTDGDRRADIREVVFDGFRLGVTDSNVNGLRWGIDNRVHGANGGNDGKVFRSGAEDDALNLRDLDFAFDPRTRRLEETFHSASGFGLIFNETGDSFSTYNIEHIQQRVFPIEALRRLPGGASEWGTVDISDHGAAGRIYPVASSETRVNHPEQAGHFSAAGGMGVIPAGYFSERLVDSVLVGDVVGNLLHRDRLVRDGPVFRATRAEEEQQAEFIASFDRSFRPVGCEVGPDGALYLVDMQRAVIEHPDYIPAAVRDQVELREGADRGRIYRVVPREGVPYINHGLAGRSNTELVAQLSHTNQWVRNTAHRLLIERDAREQASQLATLVRSGVPLGKLHGLWVLEGLGVLDQEVIQIALKDDWFALRRAALRVLTLHEAWYEDLWSRVVALTQDPDEAVQFQALLLLGRRGHASNVPALLAAFWSDRGESKWIDLAIRSALGQQSDQVLRAVFAEATNEQLAATSDSDRLADLVATHLQGAEQGNQVGVRLLQSVLQRENLPDQALYTVLRGINEAKLSKSMFSGDNQGILESIRSYADSDLLSLRLESCRLLASQGLFSRSDVVRQVRRARTILLDTGRSRSERLDAIRFFEIGEYSHQSEEFWLAFWALNEPELQAAMCRVVSQWNDPEIASRLISGWRELFPVNRPVVLQVLLRRRDYHEPLITALEGGVIGLGEVNLDLEQRRRLRRYSTEDVQVRARVLFGDEEYSNRADFVDEWYSQLPANGDRERGLALYKTHCAPCHRWGDEGYEVGPPLSSLGHRSVEDLAYNILDPDMAINPRYGVAEIETIDGELLQGIVTAQNKDAVTLAMAQGLKTTIKREAIDTLRYTTRSLMPSGWESVLTHQQLRDLIALLRSPLQ